MKIIACIVIVLIASATAVCSPGQDTTELLTLDDCIKIALEKSSRVLMVKDSVRLSGIELLAAYGQFLPNLSFNATDDYTSGKQLLTIEQPTIVDARVNNLSYQLNSSFNIFNGLYDYATLKSQVLNKKATDFSFRRAQQAISFDITQTYLQMVVDSHVVNYAVKNLGVSLKREEQLTEETRVGRTNISDLYQQQSKTSQDKLYLIQSQTKLYNDYILLLTKLRITETDKYRFADLIADTIPLGMDYQNQQQVIDEADHYRPDLKAADLNVKMAEWKIKQNQSGYYPKLNLLYGGYSTGGYFNRLSLDGVPQVLSQQSPGRAYFGQIYGGVELSLNWTIFDKLYTKTAVDEARINQDIVQLNHDDLIISISADMKMAYNNYVSAVQQLETANKGLRSARLSFAVLQDRYNEGNADFIELSNAQAVYFEAQLSKEQAAISLMLQKITIDYYIGK
jgi:outer membrane protein